MPRRVRFGVVVPPAEQAEIAVALVPLADRGWSVNVDLPVDGPKLGWRITLEAPGAVSSFRVRRGATASEWLSAVRAAPTPPRSAMLVVARALSVAEPDSAR